MHLWKKICLLVCMCGGTSLSALDIHSIPLHRIQANTVKTEGKKIILEGAVKALLDLGTVDCGKAVIWLDAPPSGEKHAQACRLLEMEQHVVIHFSNGSMLSADRGTVDCIKREGVFFGSEKEKVVYETLFEKGDTQSHMKACSNSLRGVLVKVGPSWTLDDLHAEGAVSMEYRPVKE